MTTWQFITIIVPASLVEQARELGAALDPAGAGMYTTPLSPTGAEPATHYISSGLLYDTFPPLLADAALLYAAAQQGAEQQGMTLTATLEDAYALVAQSDVSSDAAFYAMERLGLVIISQYTEAQQLVAK